MARMTTSQYHQQRNCCSSMKSVLGLQTLCDLGRGGQGAVFLCTDQTHDVRLACKTIRTHAQPHSTTYCKEHSTDRCCRKRKLHASNSTNDVQHPVSPSRRKLSAEEVFEDTQLRWEAEVLHHLSNIPGILRVVSTFEGDNSCFHLVTPFCDGGDLLSKLDAHPPLFKLSEREAAPIVASLAHTLAACHARGIVHRDIKPGNILFRRVEGTDCEEVVLADFGLAATITPGESLCDRVGTSRYQAPEVIQGQYDHRADIWSLGITLYLLITSMLPFIEHLQNDAPDSVIQHAILCSELKLEGFGLSSSAQDLLQRILCKNPNARLTLDEILCHPWLLDNMEPIDVNLKQTKNGVSDSDNVIKVTKTRRPMNRKCFRQHWHNAIANAAVA